MKVGAWDIFVNFSFNFRLIATWVRAVPISVFSPFYNANIVYNILKEFKSNGPTNKFTIKGSLTKGW